MNSLTRSRESYEAKIISCHFLQGNFLRAGNVFLFRNHCAAIAAWVLVYVSLWLSKENFVRTKFSDNSCHTGFISRAVETVIFPFRWYKNRPTYEYIVGLVLLCCIGIAAILKCLSLFVPMEQAVVEAIFERCSFTFLGTICAVCGYYCLIVDVSGFERIIHRIAAIIFMGFAIVSLMFVF